MRLLCLSDLWLPFPGGAERLMFNLARDLAQRGHRVRTLTGYEAAQRFDGPAVQAMPIGVGPDHAAGAKLVQGAIERLQPNVVLTHHFYAAEFADVLADCGVPVVQVVLNGRRLPFAALAVYISQWVRDQLGDSQPQDMVLTPPAFPDVVADTHGPAIGFIKPIPHKGVALVHQLAEAMPERPFVVLRGEWQGLEVTCQLPNLRYMQPVADMRDFYSQCRLLLVPSLYEDAGTVAQEATLNGLPCLSTNVGGLAETNAGGVLLAADDSVDAWRGAVLALDDPRAYAEVVQRQQLHLQATDHAGTMALLAERVAAL